MTFPIPAQQSMDFDTRTRSFNGQFQAPATLRYSTGQEEAASAEFQQEFKLYDYRRPDGGGTLTLFNFVEVLPQAKGLGKAKEAKRASLVTQVIHLAGDDYRLNQASRGAWTLTINPGAIAVGAVNTNFSSAEFTNLTASVKLTGTGTDVNSIGKKKVVDGPRIVVNFGQRVTCGADCGGVPCPC